MGKDPFNVIIDNYAGILDEQKEGSVKDILNYYVEDVIEDERDEYQFRMDIGTGYLFFSGFRETYDLFKKLHSQNLLNNIEEEEWESEAPIRVVMGPETSGYTKDVLTSIIKDDISTYPDKCIELLKELVDKNLIDFKIFLDKNFHPKLYNFYKTSRIPDDTWAGSANFSKGGMVNNVELNIPMFLNRERRELMREWFDKLWAKASEDIDLLEVIEEVKESEYIYNHPKIFFSKLIKLLQKDYLLEEEKKWSDNILLEFQNLSYYIVMERLQKYGGYILANSVGLGKSYVACQAMRSYLKKQQNKKCLVIVPPRVKSEWEEYLEEFDISEYIDLVSMGLLQKTPFSERDDDEYYFDHRNYAERYSLIVVDEIHHYRNNSNRRENLKNIIKSNPGADSLFLGATPVNLGSEDLFRLIDLFYDSQTFEAQGLKEVYDRTRRDVKNMEGVNLTNDILERIKEIEKELTLKISWRIVQKHFEKDLKELSGEKAEYEEPETKEISYTYPSKYKEDIFDDIVPFLQRLSYEPAKLWDGQGYKDDKNLTFWYKWQLYKRLESSLYAFYKSIKNLKDRFYVYKEALKKEKIYDLEDTTLLPDISSTRFKSLMDIDRLSVIVSTFSKLDEELKDEIIKNIKSDYAELEQLLDRLEKRIGEEESFPYPEDKKLDKLKKVIQANLKQDRPTIIFSEWKDTIDYLYQSLKDDFDKIDYIHGDSGKSKEKLIEEFQDGVLDVILTTDVLSEGVNIPRADSIINFDLPYNPVILVQRSGRALRITNPKKIYVHNFKPADEIDKELELYNRLELRLKTILDIIGLDFIIWMMDEREIEEIHEKEHKEYLENYSDYKEEVANKNPDDLMSSTLPEESKLDRAIRRSINKYSITSELVNKVSPGGNKPFYTVLKEEEDFFLITQIGDRTRFFNDIKESLEVVDSPSAKKISKTEKGEIDWLINKAKREIAIERTSRRSLSRKTEQLIERIKLIERKFEDEKMIKVFENINDLLKEDVYLPEEIEKIEDNLEEINNIPSSVSKFDKFIKGKSFWKELESLSKKSPTREEVELKALIKYTRGE